MKKIYILVAVVVVLLAGGAWWHWQSKSAAEDTHLANNLGAYAYECDEHVAFTMTPSSDMSTLTLSPTSGAYPPAVTLTRVSGSADNRYEGGGVIFTAKGETVTLGEGDSAINCSPVPDQDNAPFNWGDGAAE